jgi:pimeloyl-ACP methyl ester carboxylesterase
MQLISKLVYLYQTTKLIVQYFYITDLKMKKLLIPYRQSIVSCSSFGKGAQWLICFHGYGENNESFSFLEPYLGETYTLIAIDLPFHGQTLWNEGLNCSQEDLWNIITLITGSPTQPVNLIGYSMGGRITLKLLEKQANRVAKVVLLAPDGLHSNPWHWLATQTIWGNRLFRYTMERPDWFFRWMKWGNQLGILNKSIFNFAHYYLDEADERMALYQRWTTFRSFHCKLALIKTIIFKNNKHLTLLFGKYDRIILTAKGRDFQKGLENYIFIRELQAGHLLLKEKYAAEISAAFQS